MGVALLIAGTLTSAFVAPKSTPTRSVSNVATNKPLFSSQGSNNAAIDDRTVCFTVVVYVDWYNTVFAQKRFCACVIAHSYYTITCSYFFRTQDALHDESRGGSYRRNRGNYYREDDRTYRSIHDWGRSRRGSQWDRVRSDVYSLRDRDNLYGRRYGASDFYDDWGERRGRYGGGSYYGSGYVRIEWNGWRDCWNEDCFLICSLNFLLRV